MEKNHLTERNTDTTPYNCLCRFVSDRCENAEAHEDEKRSFLTDNRGARIRSQRSGHLAVEGPWLVWRFTRYAEGSERRRARYRSRTFAAFSRRGVLPVLRSWRFENLRRRYGHSVAEHLTAFAASEALLFSTEISLLSARFRRPFHDLIRGVPPLPLSGLGREKWCQIRCRLSVVQPRPGVLACRIRAGHLAELYGRLLEPK